MLQPDMLSQMEPHNEMSYPGMRSSVPALFDINQVSSNSNPETETEACKLSQDEEAEFEKGLVSTKKLHEEDVGLRIDSTMRRSFAQNALFRSESKILHHDIGYGSEEDYSETCEFEAGYSHESSMNFSSLSRLNESSSIVN